MVIYQNMAEFNSYLSVAVPQTLYSADRERIAWQIATVLKQTQPGLKFKKVKCLDVGSSSGEVASYLGKYVNKIICLDVDKNALSIGKKKFARHKNLRFAHFDGAKIPFNDNLFDVVILRRVIECTKYPEKLMAEIFRVLKPKGLVYFESQNIIWPDPHWDYFAFVPPQLKKVLALAFGKKHYYFATYRSYWQLKKLFKKFRIHLITPLILKNPIRYNFSRLKVIQPVSNLVPSSFFYFLEPFNRHFIWVLEKP